MAQAHDKESALPPLWVLVAIAIALFLWLLIELKEIVVLLVVAYCFAYVMQPALARLERRRVSRPLGFIVVILILAAFLALLALTALPTIVQEYTRLANNFPNYIEDARLKLNTFILDFKAYLPETLSDSEISDYPQKLLEGLSGETLQNILRGILSTLLRGYDLTLTIINLALLPFITFYLAVDFKQIHSNLLMFVPLAYRRNVYALFKELDTYVSNFLKAQLWVASILFILYALGLGLLGVELWLLLAAISGFGNMVPYFGFLVGIILSSVMALVTSPSLIYLLEVWGVYALVQFLEGTIVSPRVLGDKVGISPLLVILAIFAGGQLFGILGIFLAVPGAAAVRVFGNHMHKWFVKQIA